MKRENKDFIIAIIVTVVIMSICLWGYTNYILRMNNTEKARQACKEYAELYHPTETGKRKEWLLEQGFDYDTDFDWYQSCLNNLSK